MKIEAEIVICSIAIVRGEKRNNVGDFITRKLDEHAVSLKQMSFVADDPDLINGKLLASSSDLIVFSGGTSKKSNYVVIDAITPQLDKRFIDLEEEIMSVGVSKSDLAQKSIPLCGKRGKQIVIALPGSTNGASDALEVLLPKVLTRL